MVFAFAQLLIDLHYHLAVAVPHHGGHGQRVNATLEHIRTPRVADCHGAEIEAEFLSQPSA